MLAAIDLTAITGGLTLLETALLGSCTGVIAGGMGLMAIKYGARWIKSLWRTIAG